MKKILPILLIFSTFVLFSQDADEDFFSDDMNFEDMDMDSMFGDANDDSFLEVVEDKSNEIAAPSSELLTTTGVEWGGSFNSSITTGVSYSDFPSADHIFNDDYYSESFSPDLSASLHFNARPTESTRFFGKFTTEIPFYKSANALIEDPANPGAEDKAMFYEVKIPEIKIYELFTDFNYNNKLFFRVGKQNAKWGVGYFFSPADFLSLETIDPENPTADREGPIAIKMSMPFGLNNLYTYITVPNSVFSDGEASISDLILAPMFQMLIGDTEISTGIYFQKDSAKRAMVSATYGTNFTFGKLSFFGEAVGLYGSDKTFITDEYLTKTYDDKLFFNGTAGFMWSKTILENNFSLVAQYFYNGEGYDNDSDVVKNVMGVYQGDISGIPYQYLSNVALLADSDLGYSDLMNRSQHYLGASFGISNLFDNEDLSLSAFTMMNLADISGFVKPSISYTFF
ncbi:MAG: hypothetical protein JXR64_00130, partial [Spirochaetales bacterium]|nr:hypothetical protein [Spirochaetales bacterium]